MVLSSDPATSPGLVLVHDGIRRTLGADWPNGIEIYHESLDTVFMTSEQYRVPLQDWLRIKYAERPPDVVMTAGTSALRFAALERDDLFPRVPIVFCHVPAFELPRVPRVSDLAGLVTPWSFDEQIDIALRLFPQTQRAVIILGSGPLEQGIEGSIREQIDRFAGRLQIDWWVGMPLPQMEQRLAHLPARTIVLNIGMYRDREGRNYTPIIAMERIVKASNSPVFGIFNHWLGTGLVGAGGIDYGMLGSEAARITARVLRGEKPDAIGILQGPPEAHAFDARQLKRFSIARRRLPEGSVVMFHQPTLWEQHRFAFLAGLTVIALQSVLLGAFATQWIGRRRAESSELASRRVHASLVDSLDVRVATIDRNGTIVEVNRAWLEFGQRNHGRPPLAVGDNYLGAVRAAVERGREDAQRTLDSLTAVLDGGLPAARLEYFAKGEERERVRNEIRFVALHRPEGGALVTIQDITDRWRAEERVRVALESLPLATILLDEAYRIELVNAQAEEVFGFERERLLGRSIGTIVPGFSPAAPGIDHVSKRTFSGRRRDGSDLPLEVFAREIELGGRAMILASFVDLSERRRMDAEMQSLREEASHFGRVAAVGEMSAAIAHELNQPLTGILTNAQAAERFVESGEFSRGDLEETLGDIAADARRAGEVIQRLRLMLRKGPAETREIEVNDLVNQVVRLVHHDLAMRGTVLDLDLTEHIPAVAGDRVHLQQLILNLVLNAADAMADLPPEGRKMRLRTARGSDRTVEIEIRDSGPGVAATVLPHIFEPFFTTKKSGMGMGLSIVRSIVETHGGQITVANDAGQGAVFTVSLPAKREGANA